MRNKTLLIASFIFLSTAVFVLLNSYIITSYFHSNPIVICNGAALSDSCLIKSAVDLGIKKEAYVQCFQGLKYKNQILDDQQLATDQDITFGPTLLAGATDNNIFIGFDTSLTTYAELTVVMDDINNVGLQKAQENRAVLIKQKVEDDLLTYLKSEGLSGAALDKAYQDNQDDVATYMERYNLKQFDANEQNIIGNGIISLVYFVDFGSSGNYDFAQNVLVPLASNELLIGGARLIIKDMPVANEVIDSLKLANAVRCAGEQGKYQIYFDYINTLQSAT